MDTWIQFIQTVDVNDRQTYKKYSFTVAHPSQIESFGIARACRKILDIVGCAEVDVHMYWALGGTPGYPIASLLSLPSIQKIADLYFVSMRKCGMAADDKISASNGITCVRYFGFPPQFRSHGKAGVNISSIIRWPRQNIWGANGQIKHFIGAKFCPVAVNCI